MTTATTPTQQQTVADTTTDWSQTLDFAQFDPSFGTLSGIAFGFTGDIAGNVILDNLDLAPSTFGVSLTGIIGAGGPSGGLGDVSPVATASANLAAGATDALTDVSASASMQNSYSPATDPGGPSLAPLVGTGSVPVTVTAEADLQVTGSGNMTLVSQAAAGASASLQYDYTPPVATTTDSAGAEVLYFEGDGGISLGDFFQLLTPGAVSTVTTAAQTFNFADRTTGWNDSIAVDQFNPALGTLKSVNITLSGSMLAQFSAENLGSAPAKADTTDTATLTLDLPVVGSTETVATSTSDSMSLAAFDGSADFAGTSGHTDPLTATNADPTDMVSDPADLSAFTGQRVVVLPISGTSAATIDGPGNLMAGLLTEAGGTVSVSYTYLPGSGTSSDVAGSAGGADYSAFDATTNAPAAVTPQPYSGAGPTQQLIDASSDNLDVTVTSDNWLIGTGAGNDVLIAHGGNNILCAGGGSNWLFGAGGDDTFSVHAGGGDAWNEVENFHAGDWLLVNGVSSQDALSWFNGQGAAGQTGLTLQATAPDGSSTLVTLAHYYSTADLANGRLSAGFGDGFFYVHANS